tara:strand:+ start:1101 stop:1463 length:363 start_codon:yes stop_codon:yes gene_type:complete
MTLTNTSKQKMDEYLDKKESFEDCARALKLVVDKAIRLSEITEELNDYGEETCYAYFTDGNKNNIYDYEITIRRVERSSSRPYLDPGKTLKDLVSDDAVFSTDPKNKGNRKWLTKDQSTT